MTYSEAQDGMEALTFIAKEKMDLILVDLNDANH